MLTLFRDRGAAISPPVLELEASEGERGLARPTALATRTGSSVSSSLSAGWLKRDRKLHHPINLDETLLDDIEAQAFALASEAICVEVKSASKHGRNPGLVKRTRDPSWRDPMPMEIFPSQRRRDPARGNG